MCHGQEQFNDVLISRKVKEARSGMLEVVEGTRSRADP